jgi:23S rRNA (uridine2552-2'-O)-methyltransferase
VLHGLGAGALADRGQCHFALVAVERRGAHLDQLVVRKRAVDLRDHRIGKAFPAELQDRVQRVGAGPERLAIGGGHVLAVSGKDNSAPGHRNIRADLVRESLLIGMAPYDVRAVACDGGQNLPTLLIAHVLRCRAHAYQSHSIQVREDRPVTKADGLRHRLRPNVAKACVPQQCLDGVRLPKTVTAIDKSSHVSFRDMPELDENGEFLLRTPRAHGHAAIHRQRAAHLARGRWFVWKELEPLLTDHDVELLVVKKRQGAGVAFAPIDIWRHLPRHREHGGTEVDADRLPGTREAFLRDPCDDARSARDVQDAISLRELEVIEQLFDPGPEQRAHERLLVDLGKTQPGEGKHHWIRQSDFCGCKTDTYHNSSMAKSSKAWLRRHVTDAYVRKAKAAGYRSRAAYKLLEIDEKDKLLKPGMRVLDLGAAPGGWSQVAAEKVKPGGKVVAVDLLEIEPIRGVSLLRGDFREVDLERALGGKADVVLSDMMPNVTGVPSVDQARAAELIRAAIDLCRKVLKPEGVLLVKIFHGEAFEDVRRALEASFQTVAVRKPAASRGESRENYFLARGLKAH